ncbi:unnamed protein product [Coccothraustes coccothraustes]
MAAGCAASGAPAPVPRPEGRRGAVCRQGKLRPQRSGGVSPGIGCRAASARGAGGRGPCPAASACLRSPPACGRAAPRASAAPGSLRACRKRSRFPWCSSSLSPGFLQAPVPSSLWGWVSRRCSRDSPAWECHKAAGEVTTALSPAVRGGSPVPAGPAASAPGGHRRCPAGALSLPGRPGAGLGRAAAWWDTLEVRHSPSGE